MPRLLVEAVSNEKHDAKLGLLRILISVSSAEDGKPLTGLTIDSFKITNLGIEDTSTPNAVFSDYKILMKERTWDPEDNVKSGVYDITIVPDSGKFPLGFEFKHTEIYSFGLQVIQFRSGAPFAYGQTVVSATKYWGDEFLK